MELHTYVNTTRITFLVDDKATRSFQERVLRDGAIWLKESRTRLTRAINYSIKAMIEPQKVAGGYWDLLAMYFGIPRRDPDDKQYRTEINTILAKLNQTSVGLGDEVTIADLSQMPGVAKAQLK